MSAQTRTAMTKRAVLPELAALRQDLHGQICLQGEPGYDEARSIWNAMVDRLPDIAQVGRLTRTVHSRRASHRRWSIW